MLMLHVNDQYVKMYPKTVERSSSRGRLSTVWNYLLQIAKLLMYAVKLRAFDV